MNVAQPRGSSAGRPIDCRRPGAVVLLTALLALPSIARAQDPASLCRAQADAVEHAMGLPPGLLLAVGRVESGRRDATGALLPWPWTVNDEGADHSFNSAFDAIAYVVAARARGSRSLDVGCFQVNLQYHPDAFATVAEAFDPAANARYAGRLLADLHAHSSSWETAVQLYHSATPWRGEQYRDLVLSRWAETSLAATPEVALPLRVPPALATHLAATGGALPPIARSIMGIRIVYPTPPGATAASVRGRRLPRVIEPSVNAGR